jgi:phosphoribosylanthranilate isomerase
MVEVKICGITNPEDAQFAAHCGADALGFIFYPRSPRYVSPDRAQEIMGRIPETITRVGVFVNQSVEEIRAISACCRLHLLQLHGDESPDFCGQFEAGRVIKAFAPRSAGDLEAIQDYRVRAILIDARRPGLYGGTGKKADWYLARQAGKIRPLLLAGGLREDNVTEAVRLVAPRALDLNSGLESSPGKKDPQKVKRIMDLIRSLPPSRLPDTTQNLFNSDTRGFS